MKAPSERELIYCHACGNHLTDQNRNVLSMLWSPVEPGGRRITAARWGLCNDCQQQVTHHIADYLTALKTRGQRLSGEMGGMKQQPR